MLEKSCTTGTATQGRRISPDQTSAPSRGASKGAAIQSRHSGRISPPPGYYERHTAHFRKQRSDITSRPLCSNRAKQVRTSTTRRERDPGKRWHNTSKQQRYSQLSSSRLRPRTFLLQIQVPYAQALQPMAGSMPILPSYNIRLNIQGIPFPARKLSRTRQNQQLDPPQHERKHRDHFLDN